MKKLNFDTFITCFIIAVIIECVGSVDHSNFKTCSQSGFCRRNRKIAPGESKYAILKDTIKAEPEQFSADIINTQNNIKFKLQFFALANNSARLKINEAEPLKTRYEVKDSLIDFKYESLTNNEVSDNKATLTFGSSKVHITYNPFRMDFFSGEDLVISLNSRGLLNYEHQRQKPAPPEVKKEDADADQDKPENQNEEEQPADEPKKEENPAPVVEEETDLWEETFKGHTDSKPFGPTSIGLDLTFFGFDNVYGIPEHADDFSLKTTKDTDPYRLYNLDVFEYELNSPMAIYGSVPYMMAHNQEKTVGAFWNNAAEMWIDIEKKTSQNVVMSVMSYVKGESQVPQVDTHWVTESGIIDLFFFMGPKPKDVSYQYSRVTGAAPLPSLFSIGYHQCRWNYNDEDDVRKVDASFEEHDMPYDVLWLDIEHTDEKKYFTWDQRKFANSVDMINNVASRGRKMVTITDPHIKRTSGFHVFDEGTSKSLFVKNKDGADFDGWCWSGSSSYTDYFNPQAAEWWSQLYSLDNYKGSTLDLYTWIDMNEPSVFSGPEITMQKDCKHHGDIEHREVHNTYGLLMLKSTYNGHIKRAAGQRRPFILTRSFFAGSQRYGAVWTGDNMAQWSHLKITIPMLLSLSVSGISFCGADVPGFFGNPEPELLVRWYQAGSFQPFFRAHAHIDTNRREPWLFGEEVKQQVRHVLRTRQSFTPYWYTLFYENELTGVPPMRPLWMEFPNDKQTFAMQDQHLVGSGLLVHPVVEQGASNVNVYFPEESLWYDVETKEQYEGPSSSYISVTMDKIPVFQRGGSIIPKKERIRRSLSLTLNDPYTLYVALDKNGYAEGHLYLDDGSSFGYRQGDFLYMKFTFQNNKLSCTHINKSNSFVTKSWLEKVVILGVKSNPSKVSITTSNNNVQNLESSYGPNTEEVVVRKPGVNMAESWEISIQ